MEIYDFYITPEEYEIAEKNGISRQMVNNRVRSLGWNKEIALTQEPNVRKMLDKELVKKAEENGIGRETLRYRINHGWNLEDVATIPPVDTTELMKKLGKKSRKYPMELIELAKSNGISIKTFYERIHTYKWDVDKAANTPLIIGKERALMGAKAYRKIYGKPFGNVSRI